MRLLPLLASLLVACGGASASDAGDTSDADADAVPDASEPPTCDPVCPSGMVCTADLVCVPGGCGGEALDLTYVAPSFLIVLDRSCSMRTNEVPGTGKTRWEVAVGALQAVTSSYEEDIDWGITLFPDTSGMQCEQDAIPIPVGDDNALAIRTLLGNALDPADPLYPDSPCVTHIDTAMAQVASDPAFADPTTPRFVMLVSDGAQSGGTGANNCGGNARDPVTEATIRELAGQGIKTFVVGMGGNVDAAALDAFAEAGGAPLAGPHKYYSADSVAELDQAFGAIADLVVSCEYVVDPAPANLDEVYVWFENTEAVPRDPSHLSGWDYDPATMLLTLYGSHCDRLESREVDDVDVIFGCPTPPVP